MSNCPAEETRNWLWEKAKVKASGLPRHTTVKELDQIAENLACAEGPSCNRMIREGLSEFRLDSKKETALRGLFMGIQETLT